MTDPKNQNDPPEALSDTDLDQAGTDGGFFNKIRPALTDPKGAQLRERSGSSINAAGLRRDDTPIIGVKAGKRI